MDPAFGFCNPPMHLINEDLPEPEGPNAETNSPRFISKFNPFKATTFGVSPPTS